jgi:uncharacterized membrane protein
MSNETNPTPAASGMDGKTIAIISYFTLIGWIIAFVMYSSNKSQLAIFHIRQSLALIIVGVLCYIIQLILLFVPFIGWIISFLMIFAGIGILVLWIMGLIAAINGEEKPVPVIGKKAQEILGGIK